MFEEIKGGVAAPEGFSAAGGEAGIKKSGKDIALIYSEKDARVAAAFTTNIVKAASVTRNMEIVSKGGRARGIAVNSGNANACTGEEGLKANIEMAASFGDALGIDKDLVLTASTGVIGAPFPIDKIKKGIKDTAPLLSHSEEGGHTAALAIMTTDTFPKEFALKLDIGGKTVKIGAMAKGSGMIHPNMATMLAFITTDAAISSEMLSRALKASVPLTYNMVSVDGDTSTNDTVAVMANGMAGNPEITEENEDFKSFSNALNHINERLAKSLVRDGEGATKFIEASVTGAFNDIDAKTIAKSVITSNLFKAAMFGADANWGRVLCAMGYSGAVFNPEKVSIAFESAAGSIATMDNGTPVIFDEKLAKKILSEKEITVHIAMGDGVGSAKAWGCDLSYEYVRINGDYRS